MSYNALTKCALYKFIVFLFVSTATHFCSFKHLLPCRVGQIESGTFTDTDTDTDTNTVIVSDTSLQFKPARIWGVYVSV